MWSLYKNTDKGWQIEGTYNSKKESEYYLEEWQEEFPSCKFKIEEGEIMDKVLKAVKEASSSIACCLDDVDDVTQQDLEHIQDQITILENYMGV